MGFVKCQKCGTDVSDKADFCPVCGRPVEFIINPEKEQQVLEEKRKKAEEERLAAEAQRKKAEEKRIAAEKERKRLALERMKKLRKWLFIIAAVIFVCLVIGGIWYYFRMKAQEELDKWRTIEQSHSISQIQNYISEKPDDKYLSQAQNRLEFVKEEIDIWSRIAKNDTILLLDFMDKYASGPYYDSAALALADVRQEIFNKYHSYAILEGLMRDIEKDMENNIGNTISKYGSQLFKDAYAKCCEDANRLGGSYYCSLLSPHIDSETSVKYIGKSVDDIQDNTCQLTYVELLHNHIEDIDYQRGEMYIMLILEGGRWQINDVKNSDNNYSFMENPSRYISYLP